MAHAMPPLRIIAEPKAFYRERYICEGDRRRNRAQRFVRADDNPDKLVYPTIQIPNEWIDTLKLLFYIRVTLVTVLSERVPVRCIHPYPIHTEDSNVIKDPASNSLYFPISADELLSGRKSFHFTHQKLTHYQLKNYGSLRLLNSEDARHQPDLEDPSDAKKIIELYQLAQSQLLFSIATFQNNTREPIIYDISSVYSREMTGITTTTNDDDFSFRCSPRRGDWRGGDEILMVIPKIDKRRAFEVRFVHPSIDQSSTVNLEFVDAKTMSFNTPPCPVTLTRENPTISIPIVVTQGDTEIARVDFIYQSFDNCPLCNSNLMLTDTLSPITNKRSYTEFEEDDGVEFLNLTLNRTQNKEEVDHSSIPKSFFEASLSSSFQSGDKFPFLYNAIQQGDIDGALKLIEETNSLLEQENNQGETPLLLAAKLNHNKLIQTILEKRPELVTQTDKQGNNVLHLLASVLGDKAKTTIENVLTRLDNTTKERLIRDLNNNQQTPKQVANNHRNMQYIDLL